MALTAEQQRRKKEEEERRRRLAKLAGQEAPAPTAPPVTPPGAPPDGPSMQGGLGVTRGLPPRQEQDVLAPARELLAPPTGAPAMPTPITTSPGQATQQPGLGVSRGAPSREVRAPADIIRQDILQMDFAPPPPPQQEPPPGGSLGDTLPTVNGQVVLPPASPGLIEQQAMVSEFAAPSKVGLTPGEQAAADRMQAMGEAMQTGGLPPDEPTYSPEEYEVAQLPWDAFGFENRAQGEQWANQYYKETGTWPWQGEGDPADILARNLALHFGLQPGVAPLEAEPEIGTEAEIAPPIEPYTGGELAGYSSYGGGGGGFFPYFGGGGGGGGSYIQQPREYPWPWMGRGI